jgi:hypothetical protein
MAESGEAQKEDGSYIVPRFNTVYNLAMQQLRFKDMKSAKQSYSRMLQLYSELSNENVSYIDRQDAYQKLRTIHQHMYRPEGAITFGNVIIPITLVVIVLLIVFFVKPQLVGVTGFFTADTNTPPVWDSYVDEFRISGTTEIDFSKYFSDADGDKLTYISTGASNLAVVISENIASITPEEGIKGTRFLTFAAADSTMSAKKRVKIIIE